MKGNQLAYIYMKSRLRLPLAVVARPRPGYFTHWRYCYEVRYLDGDGDGKIVVRLAGDLRRTAPLWLLAVAKFLVVSQRPIVRWLRWKEDICAGHRE